MPTTALTVRGQTYSIHRQGNGRSPTLLLLHGFSGSRQNWAEHLPVLAAARPVLAVDILGHGRSAAPADAARYRMAEVAADLIAILDELALTQVDLLGYSMGGRLALYTAVHHPHRVRRLILESASPGLAAAERRARVQQDHELADWIETNGVKAFVDRWERLPLWASQANLPAARRATLRRQRLQNNLTGLANSLRGMGTGVQPSLWPALPQLMLPVLLIVGSLDPKFVAINRHMATQLPQARLEIVANAGHTVHLERPSTFQTLVTEFSDG